MFILTGQRAKAIEERSKNVFLSDSSYSDLIRRNPNYNTPGKLSCHVSFIVSAVKLSQIP